MKQVNPMGIRALSSFAALPLLFIVLYLGA